MSVQRLRPGIFALVAGMLLAALPGSLAAQFNGPADTARDTVNAPHVLTTDPAILYPAARPARLLIGDNVRVTLYGVNDYVAQDRVSAVGKISLPLIDPVDVEGLTLLEAQTLITARLEAAGMFVKPQVRVEVLDSPRAIITIVGEVHTTVPAPTGSRRLLDVLATTVFRPLLVIF